MIRKERTRIAKQLNLNPKEWHMLDCGVDYIRYRNVNTGKVRKFFFGGECR